MTGYKRNPSGKLTMGNRSVFNGLAMLNRDYQLELMTLYRHNLVYFFGKMFLQP
jgi:hypothetical protein